MSECDREIIAYSSYDERSEPGEEMCVWSEARNKVFLDVYKILAASFSFIDIF